VTLRPSSGWRHLGVTVMIGQNDTPGEVFTLHDAHALVAFAGAHHLARVSMWSINRDAQCGSVFTQTGVLSNTCSGVPQSQLQFTRILGSLRGTSIASPAAGATAAVPQVPAVKPDDPASSPYPVWQPTAMYVTGYTVVWHHNIYQAKWFSTGDAPDTPTANAAQTPWQLIGPVLAGARAPRMKLLDTGRHAAWSPVAIYHNGDVVEFDGLPFRAKYYTRGDSPSTTLPALTSSPWQPLFTIPGEPQGVSQ
jgi:chitinase